MLRVLRRPRGPGALADRGMSSCRGLFFALPALVLLYACRAPAEPSGREREPVGTASRASIDAPRPAPDGGAQPDAALLPEPSSTPLAVTQRSTRIATRRDLVEPGSAQRPISVETREGHGGFHLTLRNVPWYCTAPKPAGSAETSSVAGIAPEAGETLNQLLPSVVLADAEYARLITLLAI